MLPTYVLLTSFPSLHPPVGVGFTQPTYAFIFDKHTGGKASRDCPCCKNTRLREESQWYRWFSGGGESSQMCLHTSQPGVAEPTDRLNHTNKDKLQICILMSAQRPVLLRLRRAHLLLSHRKLSSAQQHRLSKLHWERPLGWTRTQTLSLWDDSAIHQSTLILNVN